MKRKLSTISIPFPSNLMSTSRNPTDMPTQFAREIVNMYLSQSGAGTKRNGVVKFGSSLPNDATIRRLMYYVTNSGLIQLMVYLESGAIYLLKEDGSWQEKLSGLNVKGTLRYALFAGKLVICNGFDPLYSWDGSTFSVINEWVEDVSTGLTYVSDNEFHIKSESQHYAVGNTVKVTTGSNETHESTVTSVTQVDDLTQVVLADAVLTAELSAVSYNAKPPVFNYIYAAHDRLWGFGEGELQGKSLSASIDRTRVFYTDKVGDEAGWRNGSGNLQYINMADKMPGMDELVAMGVKDGLTAFFFKNYTQLWQGYDPTATGNMTWQKTIPVGAVHGDLVVDMPNDIGFFTRFGARTLARTIQTEQLDVSDLGSELDPTLTQTVANMLNDNNVYKNAQSFKYDEQRWFGFKPAHDAYVFQLNGVSAGWSLFDGIFKQATAFLNTPDGELYIAVNNQVYKYDVDAYSDDGEAVSTKWWTPWLNITENMKRWANKYAELITEQGKPLAIKLNRFKNYNSSSYKTSDTSLPAAADYWEDAEWDASFWDHGSPDPVNVRDRFVSDVVSYAIESNSTEGPMTLYGLKLHGMRER